MCAQSVDQPGVAFLVFGGVTSMGENVAIFLTLKMSLTACGSASRIPNNKDNQYEERVRIGATGSTVRGTTRDAEQALQWKQ